MGQSRIPSLTFSVEDVDPTDRIDAWREHLLPMFDTVPQVEAERLKARISAYHLGQILVGGVETSPHRFDRDKRWIARYEVDHYYLQLYLEGGHNGRYGDRDVTMRPGDIEILHLGQTLHTQTQASRTFGVLIPRDVLDQRVSGVADLHGIVLKREEAATALFGQYLQSLRSMVETAREDEAPVMAEGCLALAAAILQPTADRLVAAQPQIGSALLHGILQHIEQNLDDPNLGIDSLCTDFRLSRSYLYRLFEPHGGVANLIRKRRLRRSLAMLRQPSRQARRICDIAYACGFGDENTFGRLFRTEFGMTPSEARSVHLPQAEGSRPLAAEWMLTLGMPSRPI